jgi:hypothetical protein
MTAVTEASLLAAWEAALARPRRERALVLAGVVGERRVDGLEDLPIGEVDALLLDLRECCFGSTLECLVACPQCGEELDVAVDIAELRFPAAEERSREVTVGGRPLVVRAVTSLDLRLTGDRDSLVRRCVVEGDLPDEALGVVENILDELDPQATPTIELDCPECRRSWTAPFDVADFVWQEVDRSARRTLYEVHALATAYGWREDDVLALTPTRRSYYLQAAGT